MSIEPLRPSRRTEAFGFTEHEELWDRVTHERFEAILADQQTVIHQVHLSHNSYGEFLFVNVSRPTAEQRLALTFYGLGYHEHRERWYTNTWFWYETNSFLEGMEPTIPIDEARRLIEERRAEIRPHAIQQPRSAHARLYEMLADLTDEDGALAELDDLGGAADWLLNDE